MNAGSIHGLLCPLSSTWVQLTVSTSRNWRRRGAVVGVLILLVHLCRVARGWLNPLDEGHRSCYMVSRHSLFLILGTTASSFPHPSTPV